MAKYYDLNIPGSEVQRRLDLASHNVLAFDGILDVPVTASDELITSAESYQILYAPNGGRGEMLMSIGGTYYRNFRLQSSGKTYLDSSWYNEDGQIRKDRLFLNGAARDIYAYAAGSFGKVERDGVDGQDGITPHIDPTTKHWMLGDEDTGIVAEGQDGEDGVDGKSAFDIWLENGHSGNISDFLAWMKDTSSMIGPKFAATTADCLMVNDTPTLYFVPNGTTFNVYLADSGGQGVNAHSLATGVPGDITNYAGIYDISQDKAVNGVPATYGSLSDALGAITEDSKRKGGMTIKFIQGTGNDAKYVQYRYLSTSVDSADFVEESNWISFDYYPIETEDEQESGADLSFQDENDNTLVEFADGHVKTKMFDSRDVTPHPIITKELSIADLTVEDEQGNILAEFADGHFRTANFDSRGTLKYQGKVLSILGDSISTFGVPDQNNAIGTWTYAGNRCRYPQNTLFTDVKYQYWYLLMERLGLVLGVNESWAGSLVANIQQNDSGDRGPNRHMASITRIGHLGLNGTPDYIIVYGGTNDAHESTKTSGDIIPIGTFNTENPINYTEQDIAELPVGTFADAYRTMLIRLQYYYPNAKIICLFPNFTASHYTITNLDLYEEVIREACDFFGVTYVDLRTAGVTLFNQDNYLPDGIHPNAAGMELICEKLLKEVFN